MAQTTQTKEALAETKETGLIPIFIMGQKYEVPPSLTIQKALEYAGYQLIRGCGCRGGICGACATVYRKPESYRIEVGLSCQTVVEPYMYITQIPFFPANKATYNINILEPTGETVARLYPEIFKCIGCNTCTRSCPMDIDVLDYISQAIRGNIAKAAEESFDCVMCGLCAARCPSELAQYLTAILCRRLYSKYQLPKAEHLEKQVKAVKAGKFEADLRALMQTKEEQLKTLYKEREVEPAMADEMWEPKDKSHL
ncbi:MAG: 4Fe-4S dicluster domain-containing protein [Candidatus Aminicenantes bacterium]|nr:4Fe-4S dicluster domain-containing protein [Candidatus Aminicenantes bacterium]MDH5715599.1 4Fe-4S dicluster domain-containing protein [Candidatus Aminicenantes bacterium]